jgi:hypothetical protein
VNYHWTHRDFYRCHDTALNGHTKLSASKELLMALLELRSANKNNVRASELAKNAVPILLGLIDSSVTFSYLLDVPSNTWHGATLGIKLLIFALYRSTAHIGSCSLRFIYAICSLVVISSIAGNSDANGYFQIFGFAIHLLITLFLINSSNLLIYLKSSLIPILVTTCFYLLLFERGLITENWGRYLYFGDTHPNLGSEIIGVSIILAACTLSRNFLIIFSIPSLYAIDLMQGRSALLASLLAIALRIFVDLRTTKNRLYFSFFVAFSGLLAFYFSNASSDINSLFKLDDEYRGVGTGFVGRDELWSIGWNNFLSSPLVGNGVGENVVAHNLFLYGLAEFGLLSLILFGFIFYRYACLYFENRRMFCVFLSFLVLWVFNDRFMNLNPYPFLFYVTLFAQGQPRARSAPMTARTRR